MIHCIIIDDEPLARSILEDHIKHLPIVKHLGSFKNALEATVFLKTNKVDLILLDIHMPKLSGLDFLRSLNERPHIILTTAYREYALDGYEFQVHDYLLKPITFERFYRSVSRLEHTPAPNLNSRSELVETPVKIADHLFVLHQNKRVKVTFKEVLYIESIKDYIKIHLTTQRLVVKARIGHFESLLPNHDFIRVHRSYIVRYDQITAFTHQDVEIGAIEIPIGGLYKDRVLSLLKQ
ncbi:MAG: response regulator transcription factor [Dokdonia sp.]|jgi:DNA-binding LytR/AlgR family response regulator|nr:DNA-binding response regulator [Cytophagaceae bacterium]